MDRWQLSLGRGLVGGQGIGGGGVCHRITLPAVPYHDALPERCSLPILIFNMGESTDVPWATARVGGGWGGAFSGIDENQLPIGTPDVAVQP